MFFFIWSSSSRYYLEVSLNEWREKWTWLSMKAWLNFTVVISWSQLSIELIRLLWTGIVTKQKPRYLLFCIGWHCFLSISSMIGVTAQSCCVMKQTIHKLLSLFAPNTLGSTRLACRCSITKHRLTCTYFLTHTLVITDGQTQNHLCLKQIEIIG